MQTVLITGASGFIGRSLCRQLQDDDYSLIGLTRNRDRGQQLLPRVTWVDSLENIPKDKPIDIVINLAGAPIAAKRWSRKVKSALFDSRIGLTEKLYHFLNGRCTQPSLLINASAVGYYGPGGDLPLNEESTAVDCFSHQLCAQWEAAAQKISQLGTNVCLLRLGIVLDHNGGALQSLLPAFAMGFGGVIASGRQWMSWIHRRDVVRLICCCIDNKATGIINAVAPNPVTNRQFSKALATAMSRPCLLKTPAWLLRLLLGEMAEELLITGQKVLPERAQKMHFEFQYPTLEQAFKAIFMETANRPTARPQL